MPYQPGSRIKTGEKASKIGHLDVIESELVRKLVADFESPEVPINEAEIRTESFSTVAQPHDLIFAVDGSMQVIQSDYSRHKEICFIKTALLRLNKKMLDQVDPESPHPLALKKILEDSALFHATVFPLKNVLIAGEKNLYHSVRQIIYESTRDPKLNGEIMETLKWLSYSKWNRESTKNSPSFECPHCSSEISLPFNVEVGACSQCDGEVYLTDMLGFHLDMLENSAPSSVASSYMLVHEFLLLVTGIRHFFNAGKFDTLSRCLFIKDGPLSFRSQYVKLTAAIREFFIYAKEMGVTVYMVGQEKTGIFVDHLSLIKHKMEDESFFILSNQYIREEIQRREAVNDYGYRTNYGNKVLVKTDDYHSIVISVPTGEYCDSSAIEDFIGLERIITTLKSLRSYRYEGAIVPIELVNGITSLSTYPSARILKMFANL